MKHVLAPLVLGLAAMSAIAQDVAPTAQPSAPAAEPRPASANPFTGRALSAEQLQRELELRKLQTQLLEEQLRALNLEEEVRYVPGRKQAEAAVAGTSLARERVAQLALDKELAAAKAPPPTRPDAALRNQGRPKVVAKVEAPKEVPRVVAPPQPTINVLSVLTTGGKRSAMLEVGTDVVSVEDGQTTPYGVVRVTDQGVRLDNRTLAVNDSTIGRVRRSEVEQVQNQAPAGLRMTPSGAMVRNPAADGSGNPAPVTQLPPLVLPPAVRAPTAVPGQPVSPAAPIPMPTPASIR